MEEFDASVAVTIEIIMTTDTEKNDNIVFLAIFTVYLSSFVALISRIQVVSDWLCNGRTCHVSLLVVDRLASHASSYQLFNLQCNCTVRKSILVNRVTACHILTSSFTLPRAILLMASDVTDWTSWQKKQKGK